MSKLICIDAFKNIGLTIDTIAPCCMATRMPKTSPINFENDEYLKSIRETWLTGKFPTECSGCKDAEDSGFVSRRIGANQWYADHGLSNTQVELNRIDYWVGDTCNLKCMICGPWFSSMWKQELNLPLHQKKSIVNRLWKNLDLSKIHYVHFNGGEPLLSKEHIVLLESINNKEQVYVNYNTNGTILPTDKLLELWSKFKLVQIDFSIDDIGERFEYQRFPAKWDEVVSNLKWFVDNCPVNCMFGVNTTVSILNRANIVELDNWLTNNFNANRLGDPVEIRKQHAGRIFSTKNVEQRKNSIRAWLDKCDSVRGTDWRKTFPELVQIL